MKSFIQKLVFLFAKSELSKKQIIAILIVLALFAGLFILGGLYLFVTTSDFSMISFMLMGFLSIPATLFGINPEGTKDLIFRR